MKDDKSNIETVVKLIKKEINPDNEMNFSILDEETTNDGITIYEVTIYGNVYEVYFPPLTFIYGEQKKEIHSIYELNIFISDKNIIDKFFKLENSEEIFSIKNLIFCKIERFKFGSKYYILENQENEELMQFKKFFEIYKSSTTFPGNCKYYQVYCQSHDDFKYINSEKRRIFNGNIQDFIFEDRKTIFIIGQKGIGITTTILKFFYERNYPFFYINLKYFEKSKNELEQTQIINFEKNNLFKFLSINSSIYLSIHQNNYEKMIYDELQRLKHFILKNKENLNKIEFIIMIIDILSLIYGYLYDIKISGNNNILKYIE